MDLAALSRINVDQFYGIEIGEFPARIAEVALWMTEHAANNRLSLEFGNSFARIPLVTSPRVVNADALEINWNDVLPAADCSYVLGNPPFSGFVMRDCPIITYYIQDQSGFCDCQLHHPNVMNRPPFILSAEVTRVRDRVSIGYDCPNEMAASVVQQNARDDKDK